MYSTILTNLLTHLRNHNIPHQNDTIIHTIEIAHDYILEQTNLPPAYILFLNKFTQTLIKIRQLHTANKIVNLHSHKKDLIDIHFIIHEELSTIINKLKNIENNTNWLTVPNQKILKRLQEINDYY